MPAAMRCLASAIVVVFLTGVTLTVGTSLEATSATNNATSRFKVEPHSRTCSFGEEVELICMPKDAGGIYWVKNSTDDRVTNDGGISRLSFPCQNVYLQCCYALKRQDFCGEMVVIIMREFAAQPEDVSCFSSDLHYAYFHCIPSNTSFLSIDWYINGTIGENTSSSRQDQMKMKLTCSLLYSNTSIQCVVRYSKTCLYSRNASLYVEVNKDARLASNPKPVSGNESTQQHTSYIPAVIIAVFGTSFVQTILTVIAVFAGIVICRKWKKYREKISSSYSKQK